MIKFTKEGILNCFTEGLTTPLIFLFLIFGFTLILTKLNYKFFKTKFKEYPAYLLYFLSFFGMFVAVPGIIIFIFEKDPMAYLKSIGFSFGDFNKGIVLLAFLVPAILIISFLSVKDPKIQKQYPFTKDACSSLKKFLFYELSYLFLYYFSWEFIFRGIIFFKLIESNGLIVALAVQTIISTVYHVEHPVTEINGAMVGGFVFGLVAFITHSFFYSIILHALLGITNDVLLYLRKDKLQEKA